MYRYGTVCHCTVDVSPSSDVMRCLTPRYVFTSGAAASRAGVHEWCLCLCQQPSTRPVRHQPANEAIIMFAILRRHVARKQSLGKMCTWSMYCMCVCVRERSE